MNRMAGALRLIRGWSEAENGAVVGRGEEDRVAKVSNSP